LALAPGIDSKLSTPSQRSFVKGIGPLMEGDAACGSFLRRPMRLAKFSVFRGHFPGAGGSVYMRLFRHFCRPNPRTGRRITSPNQGIPRGCGVRFPPRAATSTPISWRNSTDGFPNETVAGKFLEWFCPCGAGGSGRRAASENPIEQFFCWGAIRMAPLGLCRRRADSDELYWAGRRISA